jgi:hypothetical protein
MKAGIDRFGFAERENVERTQRDLRIDTEMAKETLDSVARRAFLAFISRSRTKSNRLDAAKELKGLVYFSNIVVAPLLEDLKVGHMQPQTPTLHAEACEVVNSLLPSVMSTRA